MPPFWGCWCSEFCRRQKMEEPKLVKAARRGLDPYGFDEARQRGPTVSFQAADPGSPLLFQSPSAFLKKVSRLADAGRLNRPRRYRHWGSPLQIRLMRSSQERVTRKLREARMLSESLE